MKTIIRAGNVVFFDRLEKTDILIEDGKISKIGPNIRDAEAEVVQAGGKCVFAGFVDMHTHLREPGQESKEDIASGTNAAVHGGFTAVACMPNTKPVNDNKIVLSYIQEKAKKAGLAKVLPICSITIGQDGEMLTDMLSLYKSGAVAFSDDGKPVKSAQMMRLAMEYSKAYDIPILCHAEDTTLSNDGVVNEGYNSTIWGLRGIPKCAEEVGVAREILVCENLGAKVHICHVSTAGSVELIREAKKRGVKVTAETCPHYISLSDDMIAGFNTFAKVNPPLREKADIAAVIEGLRDGTIDCIATDHAPHASFDKECEFDCAAFGISGLETAFAVCYTYLVKGGVIDLPRLSKLMTKNPSEILKINNFGIAQGNSADLTIVDLNKEFVVDRTKFVSKGKNTPFNKMSLFGKVEMTFVDGKKCFGEEI